MSTNPVEISWYDTDIAIVTLHGEHDITTEDELNKALASLVRVGEQVIVDLTVVEFMDSSVLNALVVADGLAAKRGSTFTLLLGPSGCARKPLEITGLLDVFAWTESRQDAIEAARRQRNGGGRFRPVEPMPD